MPHGAADIATLEMRIYSVGGGNIGYMEVENSFNNSAKSRGLTRVRALNLVLTSSGFAFNKQICVLHSFDTTLLCIRLIPVRLFIIK